MKYRLSKILCIILLLDVIAIFPIDFLLPLTSTLQNLFHASKAEMQISIFAYLLPIALFQIVYGVLSDYFGRKPIAIFGLFIFFLGSIGMLYVTHIDQFIFLRFLQGLGASMCTVLFRVVLRDAFKGAQLMRAASIYSALSCLIPALAPLVGSTIFYHYNWQGNFIFINILGGAGLLCIFLFLPETLAKNHRAIPSLKNVISNSLQLLKDKNFLMPMLGSCIGLSLYYIYLSSSPYLIRGILKFSPFIYSITMLLLAPSITIGATINTILIKKNISVIKIVYYSSLSILTLGVLLFIYALFFNFSILCVIIIYILFIFSGLLFSNCFGLAFKTVKAHTGLASSLYGSMQFVCISISVLLTAYTHKSSYIEIALAMFVLCVFLGVVAIIIRRTFGCDES